MKHEHDIVPIWITFWVSGKILFRLCRDGRFSLEEGDYNFFRWEIIDPTLDSSTLRV